MVSKKATKRRRGDDDAAESTAEFAKPVFLVGTLWAEQPSYSVFMVDAAAAAVAEGNELPSARALAGGLPGAEHGMSFVAAHSQHGTWIVGVGGLGGSAIIYDPSTPVVRSGVHLNLNLDFPPWFESLSFRKGVPCIYHDGCPSWKWLPPPPCFPCFLDPWEYRHPPDISISSYAVVDSHILISLQQEETGTYAFHVVKKTWEKVCDKNLPFVGQAVPLGGSLFAACRVTPNNASAAAASVFHMSIKASTPVVPSKLTACLIQEFPVAVEGEIPRLLFCPLGRGSFCSIRLGSCQQSRKAKYLKHLQIVLTAFQMDNIDAILTACQTESATAKDLYGALQVKQENQIYKFKGKSRFVASLHMPVVAALSM
ncbi:unnamed protein product [Urochloa decumbens]|uniref:Uncharacterized protein n=1 Tax=Urochloa decumbens TaxID=240449 RepID=A0ABC9A796_9POAL